MRGRWSLFPDRAEQCHQWVTERIKELNAPLLGIFGNDDSHPTPEQVDIHEAELQKYGKDYEFHRFDDAGHGFFYYHTPNYRPRQAMEAWGIIFGFLDKNLSSDGKSAGSLLSRS